MSIVTPNYNSSSFIDETIKSVLAQSYTNWEMIVVDDCSSDNSPDIILSYSALDNRIILLSTQINTGSPAIPRDMLTCTGAGDVVGRDK